MKRWLCAWLLLALLPSVAGAQDQAPVIIGVFSAYQSEVVSNKITAFVDRVARSTQRPAHVITFTSEDGLRQLLSAQRYLLLFLPPNLQTKIAPTVMTPLARTLVPLALYGRPGASSLADLHRVSIPNVVDSTQIAAELHRIKPDIELVTQDLGTEQLRGLVSGTVDGAVMGVGLFKNLAPSLRARFVRRYAFAHHQQIVALGSTTFTAAEHKRLRSFFLAMPGDARDQLHQTFGISGFEAVTVNSGQRPEINIAK